MLDAIETSHNLLGQPFQRCRDLCEQLWFSHDGGEGKRRTKRGKDEETEQKQEVEVFSRPITKCLWEEREWIGIGRVSSSASQEGNQEEDFGIV